MVHPGVREKELRQDDPMTDNGTPGPTAPDTIVLVHGLWAITPGMTSTMTIATRTAEKRFVSTTPHSGCQRQAMMPQIRSSTHLRHRDYSRSA